MCILMVFLLTAAACAEGSLADAAADLKNAKTTDELLAMHEAIARDYAPELEAGGWNIKLDTFFPEKLPAGFLPENYEDAVSDGLPAEMLGLKYLAVYQLEGTGAILHGSFLDRLPAENRAGSLAEAQAVLILRESFETASGYTGLALNRYYDFYIRKIGEETVWHVAQQYTTPPHAGKGTLYGKEIAMHDLWLNVREVFYGKTLQVTDETGTVMTFGITGESSCCLTGVELAEGVTQLNVPRQVDGLTVTEIGENCMKNNEIIESVRLPQGVTRLSAGAFSGCSSLVRADLPETLEIIGEFAFAGCRKLRDIEIPDSVKVIENGALRSCDSLEFLRIPASLKEWTGDPFVFTDKVACVIVSEGVTKIECVPPSYHLACCYLPSTLKSIRYMPSLNERAVFYAPAGSYALAWLEDNRLTCAACERPEDMPAVKYIKEGVLEFRVFNGEAALYKCHGEGGGYVIPDTVEGCPVTCLTYRSLCEVECDYVVVPASVRLIDDFALGNSGKEKHPGHLYIAGSETEITQFNGYKDATIHAPEGSPAQKFAEKQGCAFEAWDGVTLPSDAR